MPHSTASPSRADPGDVLIRLHGIHKSFPGVRALRDVALEVRRGQVHALTGENGSGKSTMARIIAGAIQPERGTIEVEGVATTEDSDNVALGLATIKAMKDALDGHVDKQLVVKSTLYDAQNIAGYKEPRDRGYTYANIAQQLVPSS